MAIAPPAVLMIGFDRLARPYRWMEYMSFGRALERCRFHFLPQLADTRQALLLGDGDGRFAEQLLRAMLACDASETSQLTNAAGAFPGGASSASETWRSKARRVAAVDGSEAMLALLRSRCAFAGNMLITHLADLSRGMPADLHQDRIDLVTTHFFLDCLSNREVERLVAEVRPRMTDDARWIVSEFAVPARGVMRLPAWLVVRGLYVSFRVLTGLRAQRLPDYRPIMQAQGLVLQQQSTMLGGLLRAELWCCDVGPNR